MTKRETQTDDYGTVNHRNADPDHPLDYPATGVRTNVRVHGFDGNHRMGTGQNGGGFYVNRNKVTGTVSFKAINKHADGEMKRDMQVQFDFPVELVPEVIDELERAKEEIEEHAEERGYDGLRSEGSQRGDDDD